MCPTCYLKMPFLKQLEAEISMLNGRSYVPGGIRYTYIHTYIHMLLYI